MAKVISSDTSDFVIIENVPSNENGCSIFTVQKREGPQDDRFYLKMYAFDNLKLANKILKMVLLVVLC